MMGLDPSRLSVMIDFDGTISTTDVGLHLLERLGDPAWRHLEARYEAGVIGSRECLAGQLACLPSDEHLLRRVAGEVPLDPATGPLIDGLRRAGAEVRIVSDGFGFYIEEAATRWNVPLVSNRVDFAGFRMVFGTEPACRHGCGTCKQLPIADAVGAGRTVVVVGDGASDRPAAEVADVVFARAGLASWCERQSIRHTRFDGLGGVAVALLGQAGGRR